MNRQLQLLVDALMPHRKDHDDAYGEMIARISDSDNYSVFLNMRQAYNWLNEKIIEARNNQWNTEGIRLKHIKDELKKIADPEDLIPQTVTLKTLLMDLEGLDYPAVNSLKSFQNLKHIIKLDDERDF